MQPIQLRRPLININYRHNRLNERIINMSRRLSAVAVLAGFAWVHLPDAGDAFTAWLLTQDHATVSDEGGARIIAPTSDYEPAIAWAEAFASVLRAGGHDCTVTYKID